MCNCDPQVYVGKQNCIWSPSDTRTWYTCTHSPFFPFCTHTHTHTHTHTQDCFKINICGNNKSTLNYPLCPHTALIPPKKKRKKRKKRRDRSLVTLLILDVLQINIEKNYIVATIQDRQAAFGPDFPKEGLKVRHQIVVIATLVLSGFSCIT